MKETEVMIGDWVYGNHNHPIEIIAIPLDGKGIVKSPFYPASIEDCNPIPLTSEVLEKNHFEYMKDSNFVFNDNDGTEVIYNDWNKSLKIICHYNIVLNLYIGYIHELQHALRLCGIEKTIEL